MIASLKDKKIGFSLVEIIVYIAVLVLVSSAAVVTYLTLDDVLVRQKTERELTTAANVALERIIRDIRDAAIVNTVERTLPNEIALDSATGTTTEFYVSSGQVYADVNNVVLGPLTPSTLVIQGLTFTRYIGTGEIETELVRVALTAHAGSKAASTTKTFYSSAVLRGSYE